MIFYHGTSDVLPIKKRYFLTEKPVILMETLVGNSSKENNSEYLLIIYPFTKL